MSFYKVKVYPKGMNYQESLYVSFSKKAMAGYSLWEKNLLLMESVGDKRTGTIHYYWQYWFLLWYVFYIYESLGKS